jgi:hypothetical protein
MERLFRGESKRLVVLMSLGFFVVTQTVHASENLDRAFDKGLTEVAVNSGILFSPFPGEDSRPTLNYTQTGVEIGRMLTNVRGDGIIRGNCEILGELLGGPIVNGRGNYVANGTLWLRYNFVPQHWCIKPYAQAGAGVAMTDMNRRIVGQDFNFNLDLAAGAHYFIREQLSLNLECRFQHISNAGMSEQNWGLNALGPTVGVSWFF